MGPGANAQVEEQLLRIEFPEMLFWDQPQQKSASHAFKKLIESADETVSKLVKENGGPIQAVAHSFGGHIFYRLSLIHPEYFSSCKFIATGYDVVSGFFRLLKRVGSDLKTDPLLKKKISDFIHDHPAPVASDMWNYIGFIAQDPAFFRLYWPEENLFNSFLPFASKAQPMDMESFQNILNDFLANFYSPANPEISTWSGPIEITLGEKDPLIDVNHESQIWKKIFPQAQIKVLKDSGHFIHLEKVLKS
jgi:pimeloyl-ACP methyl ester carboxylesterase